MSIIISPSSTSDVFNLLNMKGVWEDDTLWTQSDWSFPERFNILEPNAVGSNSIISNNLATLEMIVFILFTREFKSGESLPFRSVTLN